MFMAVIGFVPLSPGSPTQFLNQLSYLLSPCTIALPHSTIPYSILEIPSARIGSNEHKPLGHWFDSAAFKPHSFTSHVLPHGNCGLNAFSHCDYIVEELGNGNYQQLLSISNTSGSPKDHSNTQ